MKSGLNEPWEWRVWVACQRDSERWQASNSFKVQQML